MEKLENIADNYKPNKTSSNGSTRREFTKKAIYAAITAAIGAPIVATNVNCKALDLVKRTGHNIIHDYNFIVSDGDNTYDLKGRINNTGEQEAYDFLVEHKDEILDIVKSGIDSEKNFDKFKDRLYTKKDVNGAATIIYHHVRNNPDPEAYNKLKSAGVDVGAYKDPVVLGVAGLAILVGGLAVGGVIFAGKSTTGAATASSSGACFTKDTDVKMADGSLKPIAEIKMGEEVQSFDFKKNKIVNNKVTGLFTTKKDSFLHLNNLKVTEKHPFAVGVDNWKEAGKLKVGDQVLGDNKITIKNIKRVSKPVQVFNLTVNGTHNYYVDDCENSFLVHNKAGAGCFIKGSKVLMANKSRKGIEQIKVGDQVSGFNVKTKKWGKYPVTDIQKIKNKKGYFIVNNKLKVSPVHKILVNNSRKTAPEIMLGDTIINGHKKTKVTSLQYVDKKADRHNIVLGKKKNVVYMVNDVLVYNGW